MSDKNRDEFSEPTKREIAKRAAYYCSKPSCRTLTVGPDGQFKGTTCIGQAAHLHAASKGGPRYNEKQSSEERASAENGIWMCENDARDIDNDEKTYPIELLRKWKGQHDTWVRDQIGKQKQDPIVEVNGEHVARGKGEVIGLDIEGPAIIKPGTRVLAEGEGKVTGTRIGSPKKPN